MVEQQAMQLYAQKYHSGKLEETPPVTEQDYLNRARYYFGMYSAGQTSIGMSGINERRRSVRELRDRGRGMQNMNQFFDKIIRPDEKNQGIANKREQNISKDPVRIYSKMRKIVIDKFKSIQLDFQTEANDERAGSSKRQMKNIMKLLLDKDFQQATQGLPFRSNLADKIEGLTGPQDVDFLAQMGSIRLATEILMKDGLDATWENSEWDTLAKMFIEDIIDLNMVAAEVRKVNGQLEVCYVDPARSFARKSIYPDYRDTDFRGYLRYENVAEIVRKHPHLSSEKINAIKKQGIRMGKGDYQYDSSGYGYREDYVENDNGYNRYHMNSGHDFGVAVVKLYFIETKYHKYVEGITRYNSLQFQPVDANFQLSERAKRSGRKVVEYPIQTLHKVEWVVGADIVLDYGVEEVVVREGRNGAKKAIFPLVMYKMDEPSLTERIIGIDNDIQMAVLKIRQLLASIPPGPRMIFDASKMEDSVTIAGKTFSILDMIQMYQYKGIMVIKSKDMYDTLDEMYRGSKPINRPFEFVETGIIEDITILNNEIASKIDQMRQVLGINPIADGTNQNPDMLKSVMSNMAQATNSALQQDISTYVDFAKNCAKYIMYRWITAVQIGEEMATVLPTHSGASKLVEIDDRVLDHNWNLSVRIINKEDLQMLMADLQSKKEIIPAHSYIMIHNTIMAGDLKKAQLLLAKASEKAKEDQYQRDMQLSQANAQANAQASQMSEQAKQQTLKLQMDLQSIEGDKQLQRKLVEMNEKNKFDQEMLALKNKLETQKGLELVKANNQNRLEQ